MQMTWIRCARGMVCAAAVFIRSSLTDRSFGMPLWRIRLEAHTPNDGDEKSPLDHAAQRIRRKSGPTE